MTFSHYFNPKKTINLFGHLKEFEFFKKLIAQDKLPKVLLLTGDKGIGKSTLINHLMYFYFDKNNYDHNKNLILKKENFYNQFTTNIHPNIFYFESINFKNIKIEDIRKLKLDLNKSSIISDKRFVILNDVETFNINCLNALLKIIEEPNINVHFFLINNKTKSILETVRSRCIEFKIILNNNERIKIIDSLIKYYDQKILIDKNHIKISPGNFIKFNWLFNDKKINIRDNFLSNLNLILGLYKKEKDIFYKDFLLFFTEYYLQINMKNELIDNEKLISIKMKILNDINNFFLHNLSQYTLEKSIGNNLINE